MEMNLNIFLKYINLRIGETSCNSLGNVYGVFTLDLNAQGRVN